MCLLFFNAPASSKLYTLSLHDALPISPDLTGAQSFGPFTRLRPPSYLGREPVLVGTAFGLRVGERSGVIEGEGGYFIIQSLGRQLADSTAWLKQRDVQRTQLRQAVQQARIQQYMEGVRAKAKVVDRRKDIFKSQAAANAAATTF